MLRSSAAAGRCAPAAKHSGVRHPMDVEILYDQHYRLRCGNCCSYKQIVVPEYCTTSLLTCIPQAAFRSDPLLYALRSTPMYKSSTCGGCPVDFGITSYKPGSDTPGLPETNWSLTMHGYEALVIHRKQLSVPQALRLVRRSPQCSLEQGSTIGVQV